MRKCVRTDGFILEVGDGVVRLTSYWGTIEVSVKEVGEIRILSGRLAVEECPE